MIRKAGIAARLARGSYTPFLRPYWDEEEENLVRDWLAGGTVSRSAADLTQSLARLLGEGTLVLRSSGSAALQGAIEALSLEAGSSVAVPTYACSAVPLAVKQSGFMPVFVDVDNHFNMSLESLTSVQPEPKAVVVVHTGGVWARDLEEIVRWARPKGIWVIEDAAQALGLVFRGSAAGCLGDAAIFSSGLGKVTFGPGGGWIYSRSEVLDRALGRLQAPHEPLEASRTRVESFCRRFVRSDLQRARALLMGQLATPSAESVEGRPLGFPNYSMTNLDMGLITLQLRKLPEILEERATNASKWRTSLEPMRDRGFLVAPKTDNIFLKMWISPRSEEGRTFVKYLQKALWARGVETEPLYTPLHMRLAFDRDLRARSLSVAERLWRDTYSLPVRPNLYPEHWSRIERAVEQALGNLPSR